MGLKKCCFGHFFFFLEQFLRMKGQTTNMDMEESPEGFVP